MNGFAKIEILYSDNDIIAVNKPSGISTIPNNRSETKETLLGIAVDLCGQKLFVVHRLDKDTSGVVLFAKNAKSHRDLNIQFEQKKVIKKYIAVVKGKVDFKEKEINIPISKSKVHSKKVALAQKGLEAKTLIGTIKTYKDYSLLEVRPVTGKRHQIRLHLKAINHPLAIDPLYGNKEPIGPLNRLPLHAESISFRHPSTLKEITIKAPVPEDMKRFIGDLKASRPK